MKTILSLFLLALAGCATTGGFEKAMASYMGDTEASLVSRLGPPNSVYQSPDGTRVLTYARSSNMQLGGQTQYQPVTSTTNGTLSNGYRSSTYSGTTTTYQAVQAPVYNVPLSCTVNFTIDSTGRVQRWSANGNHCVA